MDHYAPAFDKNGITMRFIGSCPVTPLIQYLPISCVRGVSPRGLYLAEILKSQHPAQLSAVTKETEPAPPAAAAAARALAVTFTRTRAEPISFTTFHWHCRRSKLYPVQSPSSGRYAWCEDVIEVARYRQITGIIKNHGGRRRPLKRYIV